MLEIKNVNVYNLEHAVIASRNAMKTEMPEYTQEEFDASMVRAEKLAAAGGGSGHSNFRKGILVSFDMKYTQYITKQFQRYHWFEYITSSSMMHRITKMDFHTCCNSYTLKLVIDCIEQLKYVYNNLLTSDSKDITLGEYLDLNKPVQVFALNNVTTRELINVMCEDWSEQELKDRREMKLSYILFMMIISNCPMGAELFVHVTTNYEQLATIYKQRKHHKLKEDWGAFCKFVESLPYAAELITCNAKDE